MRASMRQVGPAIRCTAVLTALLFAAASPARAQEKAGSGGIKVHGHWTIDVKNPDGSVASHREFENALAGGGTLLSRILANPDTTAFGWAVLLEGSIPSLTIVTPAVAAVLPAGFVPSSANLTASVDPTSGQLLLQGSASATAAGAIGAVVTDLYFGNQGANGSFTSRTLTQVINVQVGQIVQVTVAISFS
jgi:hypothetical protein